MTLIRFIFIQSALVFTAAFAQQTDPELTFSGFPSFEELYSHLNREISYPCQDCQFSIAKKREGYFLGLNYYEGTKLLNQKFIKVWDADTKTYVDQNIDYLLNVYDESGNGLKNLIYQEARFDFMYVYGYPQWITDLENILSKKAQLTSREYEMLARATSEKASDFIHPNQYGNSLQETESLSNPVYEKINSTRVEQFIKYAEKSLAYYAQIKKQTPEYRTMIITDIDLKIAHDLMHYYMYLLSVKELEAARNFLNRVHYNEGYLTYARDILSDCPQNSILITHGDTDTYPLWFLQDKEGYRRDVVVLNQSLMQTDWYLAMTKEIYTHSTNLSKTDYIHFFREPFVISEVEIDSERLSFNAWVTSAKDQYKEVIGKRTNGHETASYGDFIQLPNTFLISIKGVDVPVSIQDYYIWMVDLATFDIIGSNSNRPICSTFPTAFSSINLYQNCAKRGNIFELVPNEVEHFSDKETKLFLEKNVKNLDAAKIALMNDVGMYKLIALYLDLLELDESLTRRKELFNQLNAKFPFTALITNYGTELLARFSETAEAIDPTLNSKFKDAYASKALERIQNTSIEAASIKEDIRDLQNIFIVYANSNQRLEVTKTSNLSKTERQVLLALQKKIDELVNSSGAEYLHWTMKEIEKLKVALTEIKP